MSENNYDNATAPRSIRLVHLQLLSIISGVQKVTLHEFESLDRAVFEPALICKEEGDLTVEVEKLGMKVHYAPGLIRPISLYHDLIAGKQLFDLLKRLAPDIIHTHSSKTGILGRIAGRLSGVPVVIHMVHGYAFPYTTSRLIRLLYFVMEYIGGKFVDIIVVLNESDREIAIKRLRIPRQKVVLIPNGIDAKGFRKSTNVERTTIRRENFDVIDDDVLCVGMVGRLWEQKNPACFLRAAQRIVETSEKKVQFFVIGDGQLREELEQFISDHDLQARIQIMGWRQDVATLLSALDVFVLPSLWEGMPLAILEAMASNLPVVVSDISGNRDLVSHGVDGLLFDSDNDEQLALGIVKLIDSASMRDEMGIAGRKKVFDRYQIQDRTERVTKLYQALLAKKHRNEASTVDQGEGLGLPTPAAEPENLP